jgi:hypothetical protein
LWCGDDDERFGIRQNVRRLEQKVCEAFLIELIIQEPLCVHFFNPFSQVRDMQNRRSPTLVSFLFQPGMKFLEETIVFH